MGGHQCYLPQNPQSPVISKALVEGGWTHAERGASDKGSGQKGISKTEKWPLAERERPAWQSPESGVERGSILHEAWLLESNWRRWGGVSKAILRQKKPECWGTRANEGQLKKWGEGG